MENIIFLDIDGVLNDNHSEFLEESVLTLKQLIDTYNAKVVMITSLQRSGTINARKIIISKLQKLGVNNIDFIDPNFEGELYDMQISSRAIGIIHYLKCKKNCNYVILDDDYSNDYKLVCLNYYRTHKFEGLKLKDLSKIQFKSVNLNNFKRINYYYRQLGDYESATNNLTKVLKKIYNKII